MTAGYPERGALPRHLARVRAAADVVEIGVPFTDPMADGVTIQRASRRRSPQGVSLRWILAELRAMQPRPARRCC
jgi:tryptophan synthase alpha chain